jgi:hypothetical protein
MAVLLIIIPSSCSGEVAAVSAASVITCGTKIKLARSRIGAVCGAVMRGYLEPLPRALSDAVNFKCSHEEQYIFITTPK